MNYLGMFLAMALLDFVWGKYVKAASSRRPMVAATMASGIMILTGTVTIAYTQNSLMLIPVAAGAFVGTYLAIR